MAHWSEFARTQAQGLYYETSKGSAEITRGYTDHKVRVSIVKHRKAQRELIFDDVDDAKQWAEAQLA